MGFAHTRTGHLAWCMYGIAALGAHGALLLSAPTAAVETAVAEATTIAWQAETWELPAPASEPAGSTEPAPPSELARHEPSAKAAPAAKRRSSESRATKHRSPDAARSQVSAQRREIAGASRGPTEAQPCELADASRVPTEARPREELAAAMAARAVDARLEDETRSREAGGLATKSAVAGRVGPAVRAAFGAEVGNGSDGAAGSDGQGAGALLRGPRLLATSDPCAGFFPGTAEASRGQVQLSVDVDAQGRPHPTQTLLELPSGQGFESAAKACAAHLHFAPALDAQGHPVSARARIALRFERS